MKFTIPFFPFVGLLLLAGCSSAQECDPDQTGLFSGIGCSVGSGYNQRSQNLQNQLGSEQRNASTQQQNAVQAHQQVSDLQNSIEKRRNDLTQIDSKAWATRKKLEQAKANHSLTPQELKVKEKQLANYNTKRAQVSANPSQQDLNALSGILGKI